MKSFVQLLPVFVLNLLLFSCSRGGYENLLSLDPDWTEESGDSASPSGFQEENGFNGSGNEAPHPPPGRHPQERAKPPFGRNEPPLGGYSKSGQEFNKPSYGDIQNQTNSVKEGTEDPVPEPSTAALLGMGLAAAVLLRRRGEGRKG